jgi:hypothetical protein
VYVNEPFALRAPVHVHAVLFVTGWRGVGTGAMNTPVDGVNVIVSPAAAEPDI